MGLEGLIASANDMLSADIPQPCKKGIRETVEFILRARGFEVNFEQIPGGTEHEVRYLLPEQKRDKQ